MEIKNFKNTKKVKANVTKIFTPQNSVLKKLLLSKNMEILKVFCQKEYSEVFLGSFFS